MIFATVGTQLPFPRLIDALDAIAPELGEEVFAQVGPSTAKWRHLNTAQTLAPHEFSELFSHARLVVAHAGIGTVLSAKRYRKPLIVVPRRFALGEHRNDHQLATARQLDGTKGLRIAWEVSDLPSFLTAPRIEPVDDAQGPAYAALIAQVAALIDR